MRPVPSGCTAKCGEHGNRRSDRAVPVNERGTEQAYSDNDGPLLPLNPEERHQGEDAALTVIVHAHGDRDVFDARHQDQGPQDQRERTQRGALGRSIARQREHRLEGVEGTCPDVAENHAKGRKPRDWKARAERAVSAALGCLRSQGRSKVTMAPEAVPTRFERDTDQAAAENCCARVARTCESL